MCTSKHVFYVINSRKHHQKKRPAGKFFNKMTILAMISVLKKVKERKRKVPGSW